MSALYGDAQGPMIFPTNIGMSPRYTPLATDIVGYFLLHDGIRGFSNIEGSLGSLDEYLSFGTTPLSTPTGSAEDSGSLGGKSLWDSQDALDSEKLTTLDLFMRGQIASIV